MRVDAAPARAPIPSAGDGDGDAQGPGAALERPRTSASSSARRGSRAARWSRSVAACVRRCAARRRASSARAAVVAQPVATPLQPDAQRRAAVAGERYAEPANVRRRARRPQRRQGGARVLRARSRTHTISFGAGLLFAKDDAASLAAPTSSPDEPLSPDERKCVEHALVGVLGRRRPRTSTIVEYRFRLRPDGSDEVKRRHPEVARILRYAQGMSDQTLGFESVAVGVASWLSAAVGVRAGGGWRRVSRARP